MREANKLLGSLYKEFGLEYRNNSDILKGLLAESARINRKKPNLLSNRLRYFDEFILWFFDLSTVLNITSLTHDSGGMSYRALVGAITSHLISIRSLVSLGFDVSAKQVLRSLSEHCDALFLLLRKPELEAEFATPNDWDASNKFWHKYIKSGKARKLALGDLEDTIEDDSAFTEIMRFRREEETPLSLSSHPSYIGSIMATWQLEADDSKKDEIVTWPGYAGRVSGASVRTIDYAIYTCLFILIVDDFPFGTQSGHLKYADFEPGNSLCEQIEKGRPLLLNLAMRLLDSR
jgi:hypothetical protein